MATRTYGIPNFTKGLFMAWNMYTQAAFNICVTLKDDSTTYVDHKCKASMDIDPPLAEGHSFIEGDNLKIVVDIPQSSEIKSSVNAYIITRPDGMAEGYGFNLSVEDQTDEDYNDLYVSLVAWKHKG
jgi:hypothetical protein